MLFLKQSTEVIARFGPFIDRTDGYTEETGLAGNGTEISKNHGAFATGPTLGTHDADGWYPITLTTTHTNTVGPLIVKSHDNAVHLPVWMEFYVVEEAVFDAFFAASALGYVANAPVNVAQWLGSAAATPTVAGVPEVDLTHVAGSTTNVAALATNVDAILTDTGTTLDGRIPAALVGGRMDSNVGALSGVVQSATDLKDFADDGYDPATNKVQGVVLTDTVTTYTGNTPQTGDSFARLGAPAGASVSADIAAIEAQTDDIGAAGAGLTAITDRLPAALVSGRMDSDVGAIQANAITAAAIATDAITGSELSAAAANKIADHILRRSMATARASADGDAVAFRSILGAMAKLVNKWTISGGTLSIYDETDTGTPVGTQAVTGTAGADPITTLDTA